MTIWDTDNTCSPGAIGSRFQGIFDPIRSDLGAVEVCLDHCLQSPRDRTVRQIVGSLRNSPGKRLRPALVLLSGRAAAAVSNGHASYVRNLTGVATNDETGSEYHHPHIPVGQRPCFGTIEKSLPQLLAKYEFGSAIHLLTGYLTCCDADDSWGMNIILWEDVAYPKTSPAKVEEIKPTKTKKKAKKKTASRTQPNAEAAVAAE